MEKIGNSPRSLHEGMAYEECLKLLLKRLEEYQGEPIPPDSDEAEHPLHYAVRLVESWQKGKAAYPGTVIWLRLPSEALVHWGNMLKASREGTINMNKGKKRADGTEKKPRWKDWGVADPKKAKEAAMELAEWVQEELVADEAGRTEP